MAASAGRGGTLVKDSQLKYSQAATIAAAKATIVSAENLAESASRAQRVSTLTLRVAIAALIVTAIFSFLDWQGDDSWQSDQVRLLELINSKLDQQAAVQELKATQKLIDERVEVIGSSLQELRGN